MDKTVSVFKNGWHPQKKEGRSIRGEVTGLVGRGKKDAPSTRSENHVSRPLGSLKDPDSFGPPPKNVRYHGPDTSGLGAPLQIEPRSQQREEEVKPTAPPVPYRSNTTGLTTAGLLPPPKPTETTRDVGAAPVLRPKPKLPPRLPPRQNSQPTASPPPPYTESPQSPNATNGIINQRAAGRLANAGISVPGLGIRKSPVAPEALAAPPDAQNTSTQDHTAQGLASPSIRGLKNQFSSLTTSTPSPPPQTSNAPTAGTTWAQKQAALSTASQIQRDPSKVKADDARAAFSTANNFRQRHGEEVAKGLSVGQEMNKKYAIADKAQNFAGATGQTHDDNTSQKTPSQTVTSPQANKWAAQASGIASGIGFKKAPPPPPPIRRPTDPGSASKSPPPVPVSSKPR